MTRHKSDPKLFKETRTKHKLAWFWLKIDTDTKWVNNQTQLCLPALIVRPWVHLYNCKWLLYFFNIGLHLLVIKLLLQIYKLCLFKKSLKMILKYNILKTLKPAQICLNLLKYVGPYYLFVKSTQNCCNLFKFTACSSNMLIMNMP